MMYIVFHVRVVSEVDPALSWSLPEEGLHVLVWSKKYLCNPEIIPSPDRSWLCEAREFCIQFLIHVYQWQSLRLQESARWPSHRLKKIKLNPWRYSSTKSGEQKLHLKIQRMIFTKNAIARSELLMSPPKVQRLYPLDHIEPCKMREKSKVYMKSCKCLPTY